VLVEGRDGHTLSRIPMARVFCTGRNSPQRWQTPTSEHEIKRASSGHSLVGKSRGWDCSGYRKKVGQQEDEHDGVRSKHGGLPPTHHGGGTSSTSGTFSGGRMVQNWGVRWLTVRVWIGNRPTQGEERHRTCICIALGVRRRCVVLLIRESP